MNKRVLFISNRNILTTCGELRLIKNRAEVLNYSYGISTDFIVLANSERIKSASREQINSGGDINIIQVDLKSPYSLMLVDSKLKSELKLMISTKKYCSIILSGSGIPYYAKYIKHLDPTIKIFADVHGASEDIVELVKGSSFCKRIFNQFIYIIDRVGMKCSTKYLDGYFVVTDALKEYLIGKYDIADKKKFYIAPCATINFNNEYFSHYEEYREIYRRKYLLDEKTIAFVYSGGTSNWQCIKETVCLFNTIRKFMPNSKLLIFSHDVQKIKQMVICDTNLIIDSYRPDELTKALCAGDFAFMLRKDCITNNVAFPNKFLEYLQSRMKIITTPYVFEIAKQIRKYDLGYLYDFKKDIRDLVKYIGHVKKNNNEVVKEVLYYNSFEARLNQFSNDMEN